MTSVLLDTHTWVWSMTNSRRLPPTARRRIDAADAIVVSPASFFEIALKVRIGKWPEMAALIGDLQSTLDAQDGFVAPMDVAICLMAGSMAWTHRDPFDRLLAATSLTYDLPFVSADTAFDDVLRRIW